MDLILDVQFLKDKLNKRIPKEVCIGTINEKFFGHWIISPPYNAERLPRNVRRENTWLAWNHHGLNWDSGDVSEKLVKKTLQEICKNGKKIYVRGREKTQWLQNIVTNEIVDLTTDDPECPPFHSMNWDEQYCIQHALKPQHLKFACAVNNTLRLREWVGSAYRNRETEVEIYSDSENEQFGNNEKSLMYTETYNRCTSSGSNTSEMDKTNSLRF